MVTKLSHLVSVEEIENEAAAKPPLASARHGASGGEAPALGDLRPPPGAKKRPKRVGRGHGSGHGGRSGRGDKGQLSRAGGGKGPGFEGGQNPMLKRIPKRGFNNENFRIEYEVVNVACLQEKFDDGARVDAAALAKARLITGPAALVKILGTGELTKKLTVAAKKFSKSAAEKIAQAGGSVELV
jgi:large subunit ribosomal protein L15